MRFATLGLMLGLFTAPADAGMVYATSTLLPTWTFQAPTGIAPVEPGALGNQTYLDRFDTDGGTRRLERVVLTVHAGTINNVDLKFITPNTTLDVTVHVSDVEVELAGMVLRLDTGFQRNETGTTLPGAPWRPLWPFWDPRGLETRSDVRELVLSDPETLARFVDSDALVVDSRASAWTTKDFSTGNGDILVTTHYWSVVVACYEYTDVTAVPEPGTFAGAFLAGAVGLVFLTRRNTSRT